MSAPSTLNPVQLTQLPREECQVGSRARAHSTPAPLPRACLLSPEPSFDDLRIFPASPPQDSGSSGSRKRSRSTSPVLVEKPPAPSQAVERSVVRKLKHALRSTLLAVATAMDSGKSFQVACEQNDIKCFIQKCEEEYRDLKEFLQEPAYAELVPAVIHEVLTLDIRRLATFCVPSVEEVAALSVTDFAAHDTFRLLREATDLHIAFSMFIGQTVGGWASDLAKAAKAIEEAQAARELAEAKVKTAESQLRLCTITTAEEGREAAREDLAKATTESEAAAAAYVEAVKRHEALLALSQERKATFTKEDLFEAFVNNPRKRVASATTTPKRQVFVHALQAALQDDAIVVIDDDGQETLCVI